MPLDEFPPAPGPGRDLRRDAHRRRSGSASSSRRCMMRPRPRRSNCERAFLAALDGSCRTPIAGYAHIDGDRLYFSGMILGPTGARRIRSRERARRGMPPRSARPPAKRCAPRPDRASSKAGREWACASWSRGPQPGAGRTAARLLAAGFEPIVLPLSEIVPLEPHLPAGDVARGGRLQRQCGAPARRPRSCRCCRNRPVFAVGDETAAAARQRRICGRAQSSAGNAADLARDIVAGASGRRRGSPISAGGCGSTRWRRSWPRRASMSSASKPTTHAERCSCAGTSWRHSIAATGRRGAGLFGEGRCNALAGLVSPRAGTIFADTAFICISQRVARKPVAARRPGACLPPRRRMKMPCSTFFAGRAMSRPLFGLMSPDDPADVAAAFPHR